MRRGIGFAAGIMGLAGVLAACLPGVPQRDASARGAQLYTDFCAGCHGTDGKGNGPNAAGLRPKPIDLTQLAKAAGGKFPQTAVMAKVYGYRDGSKSRSPMPEFGALMEGPSVLVETAPGVMTPTPERLVALAEYVERLGR